MRVIVKGKGRRALLEEYRGAVRFFAKQLVTEDVYKELRVTVEFTDDPKKLDKDAHAQVYWRQTYEDAPRNFVMYLPAGRVSRRRYILRHIAHEMTHVKQFAVGELKELDSTTHDLWRGRRVAAVNDGGDDAYWKAPWEVEAYGQMTCLMVLYDRRHKKRA